MADFDYKVNLAARGFPFNSFTQGQTVMFQGQDQPYNRYRSPVDYVHEPEMPTAYYMENVIPTVEGYRSVAYSNILPDVVTATTALTWAKKIVPVVVNGTFYAIQEYYVSTSGASIQRQLASPYTASTACTGSTTTGYTISSITYARVNGETYAFIKNNPAPGTFNTVDPNFTSTAAAGLNLTTTIGILAANGYCVAYSESDVAWSSVSDATDFTPSLITGAGGGTIQEVQGKILFGKPTSFGFILYCTFNCVAAVYTGNSRYPFKFQAINGAGGGLTPELVAGTESDNYQYAVTTKGLQKLGPTSAESALPELSDFIFDNRRSVFDRTTGQYSVVAAVISPGKLTFVGNRYLLYSYKNNPEVSSTFTTNDYEYVLWYDTQLDRWGKLKVTHVDIAELPDFVAGSFTSYINNGALPVYFMNSRGGLVKFSLNTVLDTHNACLVLGRYQYNRDRRIQVNQIDAQATLFNDSSAQSFAIQIIPSVDGIEQGAPVSSVYLPINRSDGVMAFFSQECKNFSIMITGGFYLSHVGFQGCTTGRS